jgi:hypothetical protein
MYALPPWRPFGAYAGLLLTGVALAELVYCLTGGHQQALIDAASTLGLVEPGGKPGQVRLRSQGGVVEESVDGWRAQRGPEFARACKALVSAAGISTVGVAGSSSTAGTGSTLRTTLNVLLPVMVGAVLTLLVGEWRAGRERNRAAAGTLRDLVRRFHQAVNAYATAQETTATAKPPMDTLEERRGDLLIELNRLNAAAVDRAYLQALVDELGGPKYRERLQSGWSSNMAERAQRANTLRHLVDCVLTDVEKIASAVERPWKQGRRMRHGSPSAASVSFE